MFIENFTKYPHFVFAYPTEAVYGLGCNPFNEIAVNRILTIKQRPATQKCILIASDWSQIESLIHPSMIGSELLIPIKNSWPGPVTWVFPASEAAPKWLVNVNTSNNNSDTYQKTIALRITAHPIASKLCQMAGIPLISTSANISGEPPCRTYDETKNIFRNLVDKIMRGDLDLSAKPTVIRDAMTGSFLRM